MIVSEFTFIIFPASLPFSALFQRDSLYTTSQIYGIFCTKNPCILAQSPVHLRRRILKNSIPVITIKSFQKEYLYHTGVLRKIRIPKYNIKTITTNQRKTGKPKSHAFFPPAHQKEKNSPKSVRKKPPKIVASTSISPIHAHKNRFLFLKYDTAMGSIFSFSIFEKIFSLRADFIEMSVMNYSEASEDFPSAASLHDLPGCLRYRLEFLIYQKFLHRNILQYI